MARQILIEPNIEKINSVRKEISILEWDMERLTNDEIRKRNMAALNALKKELERLTASKE